MAPTEEAAKVSKSERTKNKIIQSFFHLIGQKKWNKISVKELCAQTGITRGTFYQYYNDIYDLMESLENTLLDDITSRYQASFQAPYSEIPLEQFIQKFNYSPPDMLLLWFEFCRDHRLAMKALLNRKNGDSYFIERLKRILREYINHMMDCDGHPKDSLRSHFVKLFLEMHFLSAQTWIEEGEENFLSIDEIVNLLNSMRVGSCYLSYKRRSDPEFDQKMIIPSGQKKEQIP